LRIEASVLIMLPVCSITIRRPLSHEMRAIKDLIYLAFDDKFSFIFADDLSTGLRILHARYHVRPQPAAIEQMLVADKDGEVVGVIDLFFRTSTGFGLYLIPLFVRLWRAFGIFRALHQLIGLWMLEVNPVGKHTVYIAKVGVKPGFQDQHIGQRLLQAAEVVATKRGCTSLSLYVITRNTRARHLYRKLGYVITSTEYSSAFQYFMGFYGTSIMKKRLGIITD